MACHGGLAGEWWANKTILIAELAAHNNSNVAVARAHQCAETTIRKWRKRHGIPPRPPSMPSAVRDAPIDDAWLLAALKKRGDHATIGELADYADVSPRRVRDALTRLGKEGYRVEEGAGQVVLNRIPPPGGNVHKALFAGERVRFAVLGDTHLGSKHERLEELHIAHDKLVAEGITEVFHVGDLVSGIGIFPGQRNEIHQHTYADQVAYAVGNYPRREGLHTRIISGNHDIEGEFGKIGANPVVAFCNQRDDFDYLGDYDATIELEQGTRVNLLHPKGGMSYAASYKLQKFAEAFESGAKPAVMFVGHYHRRLAFEARGIQMLLTACFESGGSFGKRLGLVEPAVGFHIVDMTIADDGSVVRFLPEWYRFWPGRTVTA